MTMVYIETTHQVRFFVNSINHLIFPVLLVTEQNTCKQCIKIDLEKKKPLNLTKEDRNTV